jgi:hypothetical protein
MSYLTPEFDDFLFARIDENGETPLSVLSVLARLGIDPWEEAARLARLPRAAAATRLASSIAAISGATSGHLDAGIVSDRLISLLPSPHAVATLPRKATVHAIGRSSFTLWAIVMAAILALQVILVSSQSPIGNHDAHTPSAIQVVP